MWVNKKNNIMCHATLRYFLDTRYENREEKAYSFICFIFEVLNSSQIFNKTVHDTFKQCHGKIKMLAFSVNKDKYYLTNVGY